MIDIQEGKNTFTCPLFPLQNFHISHVIFIFLINDIMIIYNIFGMLLALHFTPNWHRMFSVVRRLLIRT